MTLGLNQFFAALLLCVFLSPAVVRASDFEAQLRRSTYTLAEVSDARDMIASPDGRVVALDLGVVWALGPSACLIEECGEVWRVIVVRRPAVQAQPAMVPVDGARLDGSRFVLLAGEMVTEARYALRGRDLVVEAETGWQLTGGPEEVGLGLDLWPGGQTPAPVAGPTYQAGGHRFLPATEPLRLPSLCDEASACANWPALADLSFAVTAEGTALRPLFRGRVEATPVERAALCRRTRDRRRCQTSEVSPVLDVLSGQIAQLERADRFAAEFGYHDGAIMWARRSSSNGLTVYKTGPAGPQQRLIVEQNGARRVIEVPRQGGRLWVSPTGQMAMVFEGEADHHDAGIAPPEFSRQVIVVDQHPAMNIYVHRPTTPPTGTVLAIPGGPLTDVMAWLGTPIPQTAAALGAVVVVAEPAGSFNLSLGQWRRLRTDGARALDDDARALAEELRDTRKYPRPLIVAGQSLGALTVDALFRQPDLANRIAASAVILSIPATRYVDLRTFVQDEDDLMSAQRFHRLGMGIGGPNPSSLLERWNSYDPCSWPIPTAAIIATQDLIAPWSAMPNACGLRTIPVDSGHNDMPKDTHRAVFQSELRRWLRPTPAPAR